MPDDLNRTRSFLGDVHQIFFGNLEFDFREIRFNLATFRQFWL